MRFARFQLASVASLALSLLGVACSRSSAPPNAPLSSASSAANEAVVVASTGSGGEVVARSHDAALVRMREVCGERQPVILSLAPVLGEARWRTHVQPRRAESYEQMLELSPGEGETTTEVTTYSLTEDHYVRFRCELPPPPTEFGRTVARVE